MARVVWQESAVPSIQTRKGHHVLAQMSHDPYLLFFDVFRSDSERDPLCRIIEIANGENRSASRPLDLRIDLPRLSRLGARVRNPSTPI